MKCRSLKIVGKNKSSERIRMSTDANKKVGGEQRRGAKFGKLHIRHCGGSTRNE